MKIGKCFFTNFGSYKDLEFDFSNLGLILISGDTGSGKSTLLDAVSWVLFGVTSKDGAAEDVKAWDADGPTTGIVRVELEGKEISVYRERSVRNDLHWLEVGTEEVRRGKDLVDTQKLLEQRLGVSSELFLICAYMTQFSKADSFFIAKAKDRREVLEKIADQEFAVKLGEKTAEARKASKKEKELLDSQLSATIGRREALLQSSENLSKKLARWKVDQNSKKLSLEQKFISFEDDKQKTMITIKAKSQQWQSLQLDKIGALKEFLIATSLKPPESDETFADALGILEHKMQALKQARCEKCGGPVGSDELDNIRDDYQKVIVLRNENREVLSDVANAKASIKILEEAPDPHLSGLQQAQRQVNPYGEQLEAIQKEENPFAGAYKEATEDLTKATKTQESLETKLTAKADEISSLTWLYDKSFELRGVLMDRAVRQIETQTNGYLEKFFDAAIRVQFKLVDSDKLDIEISNSGHSCPFRSLSGGERTMLKLAFSLSLMTAAQDKAGASFNTVMLDEPLNGLSETLKLKAFSLLQDLENYYETVLVIEHSNELKPQFARTFVVDKVSGHSQINEKS